MNKTDLINTIADEAGITKVEADKALTGMLEAMAAALAGGDSVALTGFGTFSISARAARNGRNPQTGATISIPATKVVKFKAGKNLAETIA